MIVIYKKILTKLRVLSTNRPNCVYFQQIKCTFNNFTKFEKALEQNNCCTWHVTCCRFSTK